MGGEQRQFHVVFLDVISQALPISLEGRRKKPVLLLLLFLLFAITSILEKKQTGTKTQQGTRQKNKAADLIRVLWLSHNLGFFKNLFIPASQQEMPISDTGVSLILSN